MSRVDALEVISELTAEHFLTGPEIAAAASVDAADIVQDTAEPERALNNLLWHCDINLRKVNRSRLKGLVAEATEMLAATEIKAKPPRARKRKG